MELWDGFEEELAKEEEQEMKEQELILEDDTVYEIDMECIKKRGYRFQ